MASDALISALMKDVSEGLEVLRVRDGVELTDAQIEERCRNMVANLVGNYFIVPIDGEQLPVHSYACRCGRCPGLRVGGDAPTLRLDRPDGIVPHHGWSCLCITCADAKQRDRDRS